MRKKIIDSNAIISRAGRADQYAVSHPLRLKHAKDVVGGADEDIDQFAIINRYSLKGFEYGNWVSNNDRYDHLMAAQNSLKNLAKILGTSNIGINLHIGIAFGARGMSAAAAHYEPAHNMINLTKARGAGCWAHEYGHALDYNLGSFIDQHKLYAALSGGWSTAQVLGDNVGGQLRAMANAVVDAVIQTPSHHTLRTKITSSDYWIRRTEIFARFFEQYICYKMRKIGKDDYLTFSWKYYTEGKFSSKYYLTEREFARILPLGDELCVEIGKFLNGNGKLHTTPYPAIVTMPAKAAASKPAKTAAKATKAAKSTAKPTDAEKVYRCAQLCGANKPCKYYNIGGPFMCGLKKKDIRDLTDCQKWHTKPTDAPVTKTTKTPKATNAASDYRVNPFAHSTKYTASNGDYRTRPYYKAYAKQVDTLRDKYDATKDRDERKALRKQIKEINDKAVKRNIADLADLTGLSKPLIEALYRTTSDDELRPVMFGIFFDPAGYAVTTDAHILCVVKCKVPAALSGRIITKHGTEIAGRFPNWETVIDRKLPFIRTFKPDDNTAILKEKLSKEEKELWDAPLCRLGRSWLKRDYVAKAADILGLLGANTVQVFEKETNRATILQIPGKATIIIMPIMPYELDKPTLDKYIPLLK